MIYTTHGNEAEILSLVDIGQREVCCQIKYGDGSSAKRTIDISDLNATGGVQEIHDIIQKIMGVRLNG